MWANPMLTIPKLAEQSGKREKWLRENLRGEDPIPYAKDGATPMILWSDYVEWYQRRYKPGAPHFGENAGRK